MIFLRRYLNDSYLDKKAFFWLIFFTLLIISAAIAVAIFNQLIGVDND